MHSVWLALAIGVLFAVAAFVLPWLSARAAARAGAALANAAGGLRIATLDALTGLREVRAFGAEGRMLAAVQAREATLLTTQRELAGRAARANAGALLCGQAAILAVLIAAGSSPVAGVVAAFLTVAAFEAVGGLPRAGVLAGHAAAAAHRVLEAADAPVPVPDPPHPAQVPTGFTLRFDAVHFRWQPDRPPVFDGLTLEVPQGARVALLGPSGAGKSTLAALALKVAAPQQGRVLLGGVDIATLAAADVRARIGWLTQATHLFDDTIRANLKLARPDADDAALWGALDAARIGEMVRALPDGLDTWVGEGGARFSGGQGRRLALARALLSPAPILILDEPCAGLDAETERAFLGHAERGGRRTQRDPDHAPADRGGAAGSDLAVVRRQGDRRRGLAALSVDGGLTARQDNGRLAPEGNRPCTASGYCFCYCVQQSAVPARQIRQRRSSSYSFRNGRRRSMIRRSR